MIALHPHEMSEFDEGRYANPTNGGDRRSRRRRHNGRVAATQTPDTERRLVTVVHQLLSDCATAGGSDLTRRVLAASMTALDAAAVRFVAAEGEVLADWRSPGASLRRRDTTTLSAVLPDASALSVTWEGEPTITQHGLSVVAALLGMVEERTAADRHASMRLRQQRRAWGQEIHDGVTQSVTAAVMMLERIKTVGGGAVTEVLIEDAQREIRTALGALRDVLAQVVEEDDTARVGESLAELIDDLRGRWRLQARVAVRGDLSSLSEDCAAVARAVVRESLINIAKHTTALHVSVSVNQERDVVRLQVTDDGGGIDDTSHANPRLALRLLEERIARVGGTMRVESAKGRGTTVHLTLPRAAALPPRR